MKAIRRILGLLVMIAGVLGLLLSLAGLVMAWILKPTLVDYVNTTVLTLKTSASTSQEVMEITAQALGATVDSVDALSAMLGATATSVEETMPVLDQLNTFMGDKLPSALDSATLSLKTAQQAAVVLDSAIKSLENFRTVLRTTPLVGTFVEQPEQAYDPEVPLADSLGDLASNLETLPAMFTEMSANLDKADDNLVNIQASLTTMSESVELISKSLSEYEAMLIQSQSSMDNLMSILTNIQNNLTTIVNVTTVGLSLFFLWLLAAQVVIFSQGWELYQGTASRLGAGVTEPPADETGSEA